MPRSAVTDRTEPVPAAIPAVRRTTRTRLAVAPLLVLLVGLAATGALAIVSHSQYVHNEKRLLTLRVRDAALLLTGTQSATTTPLTSTAELAEATGGDVRKFRQFAAPYVGPAPKHQFVSMSLWRAADIAAGPVAVAGIAPELSTDPGRAQPFLAGADRSPTLSVIGMISGPDPRLGYALSTPGTGGGYVVYAESRLPADRRSRLQSNSAFTGLDYAIYLGRGQRPGQLLVSNRPHFASSEPSDAQTIPFGDQALTLVMGTSASLAGSLPQQLPWVIGVLGVLLSLVAADGARRLNLRRGSAERLAARLEVAAAENQRLYSEQRSIAQTLQHALLPDRLPQPPGLETGARYEAGEQGVDIGGDWYDLIELPGDRVLLVVGDVSGRGLRAGTTMAALRYAIRAYAAQDDDPETILTKLTHLVSVADNGQLATVLCALVDPQEGEITVTSAGHLPPLLLHNGDGRFLEGETGLPIGVEQGSSYQSTTIPISPGSTLVAFTDGLVEMRGESIDEGLERLREAAAGDDGPLADLLSRLVVELPGGSCEDDIAIVGVRWTS